LSKELRKTVPSLEFICSVICVSATDPAEIDNRLLEFRDALHEHVEQRRAEAKKLEITARAENIEAVTVGRRSLHSAKGLYSCDAGRFSAAKSP
jgi:hypothetical protein